MADSSIGIGKNWTFFRIVAGILILSLLWRALITAFEYPSRSSQILTIAMDLGLLVGLFGLRLQLASVMDDSDPRRRTLSILFRIAVFCGVGLFLIRMTSRAAWWTGHLSYSSY